MPPSSTAAPWEKHFRSIQELLQEVADCHVDFYDFWSVFLHSSVVETLNFEFPKTTIWKVSHVWSPSTFVNKRDGPTISQARLGWAKPMNGIAPVAEVLLFWLPAECFWSYLGFIEVWKLLWKISWPKAMVWEMFLPDRLELQRWLKETCGRVQGLVAAGFTWNDPQSWSKTGKYWFLPLAIFSAPG